ncbi:MAG: hypothetical protein E7632_08190 [Ruminococcaceae bacterium]|nr:hypothetical protein [Oscillospiraceae bacterium]
MRLRISRSRCSAQPATAEDRPSYVAAEKVCLFDELPKFDYFNQISVRRTTSAEAAETVACIREKYGEFLNPLQNGICIDIVPAGMNKAQGLYRLMEHYGAFEGYVIRWIDSIRGKCEPPFERGKITYYKLFGDRWCCDDDCAADAFRSITLGTGSVTYTYNPYAPAVFAGGLSANFGGNAWQNPLNSRYDIISVYTPEFDADTFVKGKIKAKLKVRSDCEDTCFYLRISLCKPEGDYGLRDDINQISNFDAAYQSGTDIEMTFSFDEHAFVIKKGEKLRIDISSSAFPHYVPHTNRRGLFSEQTSAKIARNTVILEESDIELPIGKQ